jgi:hypothetical protein
MTDLLNVVVRKSAAILQLLASEDQALLVRRDALLVLDLGLDIVDRVRGLNLEGDGLAREGLHEAVESIGVSLYIFLPPQDFGAGEGGRHLGMGKTYICTVKFQDCQYGCHIFGRVAGA